MKLIKACIFLAAGIIAGSTIWSGCYTRLATSSDSTAPEVESDTTLLNQMAAIDDVSQLAFINEPWVVTPFASSYFPSAFARTRSHKNATASTYRPLPFTATPSANSGAQPQVPTPHRQSGYQRSSPPDQSNPRNAESPPPRTSPSPPAAPSPSTPTTRTPPPSAPPTSTPATSAPPGNNRAGGAGRTGR